MTKEANCNGQIFVFCLCSSWREITGEICNKNSRRVNVYISAAPLTLAMHAACSKSCWISSSNYTEKQMLQIMLTKEMLVSESRGITPVFLQDYLFFPYFLCSFLKIWLHCAYTTLYLWSSSMAIKQLPVIRNELMSAHIPCGREETMCSESLTTSAVFI